SKGLSKVVTIAPVEDSALLPSSFCPYPFLCPCPYPYPSLTSLLSSWIPRSGFAPLSADRDSVLLLLYRAFLASAADSLKEPDFQDFAAHSASRFSALLCSFSFPP